MPARWGLDNRPRETQSAGVNHGEQTTSSGDVTSHAALSRAADVARTAVRVLSAICVCVCVRGGAWDLNLEQTTHRCAYCIPL